MDGNVITEIEMNMKDWARLENEPTRRQMIHLEQDRLMPAGISRRLSRSSNETRRVRRERPKIREEMTTAAGHIGDRPVFWKS